MYSISLIDKVLDITHISPVYDRMILKHLFIYALPTRDIIRNCTILYRVW
jgi:hypothetical protein